MAGVAAELYDMVERTVEGLGYELVDVERLPAGLLRVTLDRPGGGEVGIRVEDCERVSRQLSHVFAVEDVDYQRLEVSSPGLDRPLKRARDFVRHVGAEVQLQLFAPLQLAGGARRRLRGRLLEVGGEGGREVLRVEVIPPEPADAAKRKGSRARKVEVASHEVVSIAMADVEKAKLVPELSFRSQARDGKR